VPEHFDEILTLEIGAGRQDVSFGHAVGDHATTVATGTRSHGCSARRPFAWD
jgi:hypothetical protein